jgi:uncharacterized oxidoreductase
MKLKGNAILITGGTSGIGLAFTEKFLEIGSKVIICGRRSERLEEIKTKHPEIIIRQTDVSDDNQRHDLAQWVQEHHPDTNVLINNAGIQLLTDLTNCNNLDRVRSEIETNLIAPIHLTSLFAQHLLNKDNAAIINISSGLAFVPLAFMPIYCATKAALHSLTLSLRYQLKDTGIKVFEIAPPATDTELGHDRRTDKTQTHGGMPVNEFIEAAMQSLEDDIYEAAIGPAEGLRSKREALFESMNGRF